MNVLVDADDAAADDAFPTVFQGVIDSHGTSTAGIIAMEKSDD